MITDDPNALLQRRNPDFVRYEDNVLITSPRLFSEEQKLLLLDAFRDLRAATIEECAKVAEIYAAKADRRASQYKVEGNSHARDAALDKYEAAAEIAEAIRTLSKKEVSLNSKDEG